MNKFLVKLLYGDVIFRNGKFKMVIVKENDKFLTWENDIIYRNGRR